MSEILILMQQDVERYVQRAQSAWEKPSELPFEDDYDKQDIVILNLQRACQQVLDMAKHIVRTKKLRRPETSADSFTVLKEVGFIDAALEEKMISMVGFRNIVVHQSAGIDYKLVGEVAVKHIDDLIEFAGILATSLK